MDEFEKQIKFHESEIIRLKMERNKDLVGSYKIRMESMEKELDSIANHVCDILPVTREEIFSRNRKQEIIIARLIYIRIANDLGKYNREHIVEHIGLKRCSMYWAEKIFKNDGLFRKEYEKFNLISNGRTFIED